MSIPEDIFTNTPQTIADRDRRFREHNMSIPPISTRQQREERNAAFFEQVLCSALNVALGGNTALVIVPRDYWKSAALTCLVRLVPEDRKYLIRQAGNELHFEGTRGSVRIYDSAHIEYDHKHKRMLGYPHGIPTFLHPEVDGL